MADDVQAVVPSLPAAKLPKDAADIPRGGPFNAYGKPVTVAAVFMAAFMFLNRDPAQGVALLERFGIKWLFFCGLLYVVYDLLKLVIKQLSRLISAIGASAQAGQLTAGSMARLADGVQAIAAKTDRTAEEQARLSAFAVQTSQRAVELSSDNLAATKQNGEILQQLLARQVPSA